MKKITSVLLILSFGLLLLVGCTTNVTNKAVTVSLQNNSYSGQYTGAWENNKPSGEGTFTYSDDTIKIHYFGNFENGEMKGKGALTSTTLTLKLPLGGTSDDHVGTYTGDTVDGIPSGKGKFETTLDSGKYYSYTGEWVNGLVSGQGELTYQNADGVLLNKIGTFTNGTFTPTIKEFLVTLGTSSSLTFSLTDKATSFLISHNDLFPSSNTQDLQQYIDSTFDFQTFIKTPQDFGDKMIQLSQLTVITKTAGQVGKDDYTEFFLSDSSGFVYFCVYPGNSDYKVGDKLNIFGLPVANSTFKSPDGSCYNACIVATSYIE